MKHPCACCGYLIFDGPAGSDDICAICFWEDDIVQLAFPDLAGGANKCSLIDGQIAYAKYGACEERLISRVRPPHADDGREPAWRPLDVARDRYLHWDSRPDQDFWQTVKDSRD